jgi:hypothetical protein
MAYKASRAAHQAFRASVEPSGFISRLTNFLHFFYMNLTTLFFAALWLGRMRNEGKPISKGKENENDLENEGWPCFLGAMAAYRDDGAPWLSPASRRSRLFPRRN